MNKRMRKAIVLILVAGLLAGFTAAGATAGWVTIGTERYLIEVRTTTWMEDTDEVDYWIPGASLGMVPTDEVVGYQTGGLLHYVDSTGKVYDKDTDVEMIDGVYYIARDISGVPIFPSYIKTTVLPPQLQGQGSPLMSKSFDIYENGEGKIRVVFHEDAIVAITWQLEESGTHVCAVIVGKTGENTGWLQLPGGQGDNPRIGGEAISTKIKLTPVYDQIPLYGEKEEFADPTPVYKQVERSSSEEIWGTRTLREWIDDEDETLTFEDDTPPLAQAPATLPEPESEPEPEPDAEIAEFEFEEEVPLSQMPQTGVSDVIVIMVCGFLGATALLITASVTLNKLKKNEDVAE